MIYFIRSFACVCLHVLIIGSKSNLSLYTQASTHVILIYQKSQRQYQGDNINTDGGTHRCQVPARYFPINGAFAYSFLLDFPEFSRKCITNLGKTTICDLLSIRLSRICNYRFYIAKEQYPTSFIPLVAHQMNPDQPLSKGVQEVLLLLMQLTVKRTMFLIFSCMEKYQGNKYDS